MKDIASRLAAELNKRIANARPIEADFMYGLSDEEVAERKKDGLGNKVKKQVTKSYWRILADNFLTFFNIVFFVIAALMIIGRLPITSFFFLGPLCLNIAIGLLADIRVRLLTDRLRVVTGERATAMRNGKEISLPLGELVLSDIVVIKAGDQIPCDSLIVSGDLEVDESLLTGESDTVKKKEGDRILSGSFAKAGKCYARIEKVGSANYAESLQKEAKRWTRPKSEIKRTCLAIFWTTGITAIVMGLAMFATELIQNGWFESLEEYGDFIKSLSGSLVAMIPAGLYVLTSATLAIGVYNLYKKRMNVQELYCIEMLARVDTVCFDKTGTLTDGKLQVGEVFQYDETSLGEIKGILASLEEATGDSNATSEALLRFSSGEETMPASLVVPFDSGRKYAAATFEGKGTYIIGASEFINGKMPDIAIKDATRLMKSGYRIIGLFHSKDPIKDGKIPSKSSLICQISLIDHIKEDAKSNIEWFQSSGVQVKIISGDNPLTVSEIARRCGVAGADRFISMENVKDEDIQKAVAEYSVFGRVRPEQKAKIVEAIQNEGHKVAMTGDGVNDILALKKADCSIAMASGSSAARNVAHMVSLDNDFSKLPAVVKEGRRVINNIQRTASLFLSKTTFAIVLSLVFLITDWAVGYDYPLSTNNMTMWEFFTIGLAGFFLALQPSNERLEGKVMFNILSKALPAGLCEALSVGLCYLLAAFYPALWSGDGQLIITMATISFTLISLFAFFRVCFPFDKYRSWVFLLVLAGLVLTFVVDRYALYPNGYEAFGLNFGLLTGGEHGNYTILMITGILVVCLVIYYASVRLINRLGKKKENYDENRA